MLNRKLLKNLDWSFAGLLLLLLIINIVVLKSASANVISGQPLYYVKKEALWIFVGLCLMVAAASFDYSILMKYANYIYAANIIVLLAVFVFGSEAKGAQRWIGIGRFELQPSEFAKIAIIITFAVFLAKRQGELNSFRDLIPAFIHVFIPMLLILKQPDLGTSLVFMAIMMGMLWAAGTNPRLILIIIAVVLVIAMFIFGILFFATEGFQKAPESLPIPLPLETYQLMRLIIFVNPDMDPLGAGYHVIQSQVAIGSGGFLGKGYGNGSQVQGNFLPEHHTDFIFSVIGEELGFVGSVCVLAVFFLLIFRILSIARESRDFFGTLITSGVTSMICFQILVNAGMTEGMMPVTGIPFPLLTYGGSGMLANMIALGLVLNVNLRKEKLLF